MSGHRREARSDGADPEFNARRGVLSRTWPEGRPGWTTRVATALVSIVLLSGCAVGPDFRRPAPPDLASYTRPSLQSTTTSSEVPGGEAQRFVAEQQLPPRWWTLFESPSLDAL